MTVLVALGGLTAAHILILKRSDGYTGVLLPLDHAFSLVLVLAVFAIAAGVGCRVLDAGGVHPDGPLEALLFSTAIGLGLLATTILSIGLVFTVRPAVLFLELFAAAFVARNGLRQLPLLVTGTLSYLRTHVDRFNLSIFGLIASFLIVAATVPPTDWDGLMYHLRVPAQFLERGSIVLPEDNPGVAFVGLPHMVYLAFLAVRSPAAPALMSAFCTLGLALATFALSLRVLDGRTARFSLGVLWGSTILVLVATTPRTDTILAFYLALVQYALICALQREHERILYLYLAAALGGMAIGIKYNALIYLISLAPLAAWIVLRQVPVQRRPAVSLLILSCLVVAALPWLLKNVILLGDPVYPFLSPPRLDPWLARLSGSSALPPRANPAMYFAMWQAQMPFNLVALFTHPMRIAIEGEAAFYRPNLLLLLLPLWLVYRKRKPLAYLGGPAVAYVALVVLLQPKTSPRYLIPAIAPLTLVAFHCYALVCERLISPRRLRVMLRSTTLLTLAFTAVFVWRVIHGPVVRHVLGRVSSEAFLRSVTGDYADAMSFANERLPMSSRVLMLFEARGYYFHMPVLQDNGLTNWPLLAALAPADCLQGANISHVLFNKNALAYYAGRGLDLAPFRLDALADFTRQCLNPIYANHSFTLFEVRTR